MSTWARHGLDWDGGLQKEETKWLDQKERSYLLPTTPVMYHIKGKRRMFDNLAVWLSALNIIPVENLMHIFMTNNNLSVLICGD